MFIGAQDDCLSISPSCWHLTLKFPFYERNVFWVCRDETELKRNWKVRHARFQVDALIKKKNKIKGTESILDLDDSISFHTPDFGVWWNPATKVANHLALWEVLFCYVKCSMTKPIFSVGSLDTYCVICIWGYIVVGKVNKKWRLFLWKHGKSQGGTNQICFCFLYILVTCNTISAFT